MITVLGSINIDFIARVYRLPEAGETVHGHSFSTAPGGKGANQAVAARRAGSKVRLAGAVGNDQFADIALDIVQSDGIDLSMVQRSGAHTGTAIINVADDGENTISVIPGANGDFGIEIVQQTFEHMSAGDTLMLQMEIPVAVTEAAMVEARQRGIATIFNTAPMSPEVAGLAAMADIVVANETEFELLIGQKIADPNERIDQLVRLHEQTGRTFVVTLGASGAVAIHKGEIVSVESLSIEPVDTVGAGDTFCGYLAAGLDQKLPFATALRLAAVAGSIACLNAGAQPSIPQRGIVDNAL